jgi:hypothetical protein
LEQQQAEAHIALFEDRLEVMQTVARFEPDVWRTWMSDVLLDRSCPRLSRGGRRHARDYTDSSAPAIGDVDRALAGYADGYGEMRANRSHYWSVPVGNSDALAAANERHASVRMEA